MGARPSLYDTPFWLGDVLKVLVVALVAAEVHRAFPLLAAAERAESSSTAGVTVPDDAAAPGSSSTPTTPELTEQRIGVIGANGSGKSTLARLVNGLVEPTTGRVLVDGVDVAKDGAAVRRRVGFAFTDPAAQLVMPTCVEDVELSLRRHEKDASAAARVGARRAREFGLRDHADVSVHALSGGQKQLLALAGVLAGGAGGGGRRRADHAARPRQHPPGRRPALRAEQQLVLVTHDLDLARRCDRVLVVADARVVYDGDPDAAVDRYVASVPHEQPASSSASTGPGDTVLHRLPVGVKLAGLAVLSIAIVVVRDARWAAGFLAVALGLALVARVPLGMLPARRARSSSSRSSSPRCSGGGTAGQGDRDVRRPARPVAARGHGLRDHPGERDARRARPLDLPAAPVRGRPGAGSR